MARDLALTSLILAALMYLFGFLIGTSPFIGQLLAWGLSVVLIVVAAGAGAYAVLLEHFPPKE